MHELRKWAIENVSDSEHATPGRVEAYWRRIEFMDARVRYLLERQYLGLKGFTSRVTVVGSHMDGGMKMPVCCLEGDRIALIVSPSSLDWKVSINSLVPLSLDPMGLFRPDLVATEARFRGFPPTLVFGSYIANRQRFSTEVKDEWDLYAFVRMCMRSLDEQRR